MEKSSVADSLTSGALAGLASVIALQPLDVLKTRLQEQPRSNVGWIKRTNDVIKCTIKNDGTLGFWRGTIPTMIRNVPGVAVYFLTLQQFKYLVYIGNQRNLPILKSLYDPESRRLSGRGNLLAGAFSRTFAGALLMPATVLKVRYESRQYKYGSLVSACRSIYRQDGLRGFFRGLGATALRDAPHAGIYLFFYESLKGSCLLFPPTPPGTLLAGGMAGLLATAATQPFDLAKTRVQLAAGRENFIMVLVKTVKNEGFRGLFSGMGPRLIRKSLSSAVTWTVYEELFAYYKKRK
jgi:solute carrier family 25 protein 38